MDKPGVVACVKVITIIVNRLPLPVTYLRFRCTHLSDSIEMPRGFKDVEVAGNAARCNRLWDL